MTETNASPVKRRVRFAPPQPVGKRIELNEGDLAIFEAIHRHGPLPTPYLHAFTGKQNYNTHQHRLTKLYNGTVNGHSYLIRPPQQFASFYARYQPIVYDINAKAKQLLIEHGKYSPFIQRVDPFVHRLMSACVGASIELTCKQRKLTYVSRHDILSRHGHPMELPLSSATQQSIVPDELFGINYGSAKRVFAVEIDRNTESIERRAIDQNTFGRKLASYLDVFQNRTYKRVWGIEGLVVLIVTTNITHMQNMIGYLCRRDSAFSERFLFKAIPTFGSNWRVPPVLTEILEPWQHIHGTFDISRT